MADRSLVIDAFLLLLSATSKHLTLLAHNSMVLPRQIIPSCFPAPFPSLLLLLLLLPALTIAKFWDAPSSIGVPATWNASKPYDFYISDRISVKVVLSRLNSGPSFFFGFRCYVGRDCYLGLFIFQPIPDMKKVYPQLVWLVRQNSFNNTARMQLTQQGEFALLGDDGKQMWSTNSVGKSVVGLNLTEAGNLVLYDTNDTIIWQSFDHPRRIILPGQELRPGMKLTTVPSKLSNETALVYTFTTDDRLGFVANVTAAYSPQIYYKTSNVSQMKSDSGQVAALYKNGTFGEFEFPPTPSAQFIYLMDDGHLKHYVYDEYSNGWNPTDLLDNQLADCNYPLACGSYGICSSNAPYQCQCPSEMKQIAERNPSSGCKPSSPISCDSLNNTFIEVDNVTFFALVNDYISADISNTTAEGCKEACLRKRCSCTMALFRNQTTNSSGDCYLLSDSFSLMDDPDGYYSTVALIKVNNISSIPMPLKRKRTGSTTVILGTTFGAVLMFLVSIFGIYISSKVRRNDIENDDPDLPRLQITKFRYEDLKAMTGDFTIKLGEGGFGSVFLGTLPNGIKIAVKRLDGFGQIKKSFLAEAGTIGTIHHVNLVRLFGICAEKSFRLLVYEYMCNGSLDKWIFHKCQESDICWQVRRKIIIDIAKGLAYLHEECHQKIIHLDVKPQNILLDEQFNAKLSDFGLSKLIDKDQSHVMTTMRGTPGYLAPEWLSSVITEKVDVYSFGIVMLEVLSGRKNVDRSMPSDEVHMLTLFKCKVEQEQLMDMVDKSSSDMQLHGQEAVQMMKIAAWCLQDDSSKRPPMSQVVKCLEGSTDIEDGLRCSFSIPACHGDDSVDDATQLLPTQLSGPR